MSSRSRPTTGSVPLRTTTGSNASLHNFSLVSGSISFLFCKKINMLSDSRGLSTSVCLGICAESVWGWGSPDLMPVYLSHAATVMPWLGLQLCFTAPFWRAGSVFSKHPLVTASPCRLMPTRRFLRNQISEVSLCRTSHLSFLGI